MEERTSTPDSFSAVWLLPFTLLQLLAHPRVNPRGGYWLSSNPVVLCSTESHLVNSPVACLYMLRMLF